METGRGSPEMQLFGENGERGELSSFQFHKRKLSQDFKHFIGRIAAAGHLLWAEVSAMSLTAYIGTLAAFCTTVAFVPQIVKLRKQGGEDLSYQMLFLYLTGVLLWLVYGIRVHAVAVIWANALAGLMVLISIVLKANPPAKQLNLGTGNSGP